MDNKVVWNKESIGKLVVGELLCKTTEDEAKTFKDFAISKTAIHKIINGFITAAMEEEKKVAVENLDFWEVIRVKYNLPPQAEMEEAGLTCKFNGYTGEITVGRNLSARS